MISSYGNCCLSNRVDMTLIPEKVINDTSTFTADLMTGKVMNGTSQLRFDRLFIRMLNGDRVSCRCVLRVVCVWSNDGCKRYALAVCVCFRFHLVSAFLGVAPWPDPCQLACGLWPGFSVDQGNCRFSDWSAMLASIFLVQHAVPSFIAKQGEGPKTKKIP